MIAAIIGDSVTADAVKASKYINETTAAEYSDIYTVLALDDRYGDIARSYASGYGKRMVTFGRASRDMDIVKECNVCFVFMNHGDARCRDIINVCEHLGKPCYLYETFPDGSHSESSNLLF